MLHARGRKGETWEKQGRSGTLKFTELITEYLDENDEVVITARTVAVLTEGPEVSISARQPEGRRQRRSCSSSTTSPAPRS